jgi:alpha-mannosidase
MKKADDGDRVVIRMYEAEGRDASSLLTLRWPVLSAEVTDIIEEDGTPARAEHGGIHLVTGHNSIETLSLVPDTGR